MGRFPKQHKLQNASGSTQALNLSFKVYKRLLKAAFINHARQWTGNTSGSGSTI